MENMEFRLIKPAENGFLRKFEWNRSELEEAVRQKVSEYEGIVYTEDTVTLAKADKAELNALLKQIEERRKAVKNAYLAPYNDFESELKEITQMIRSQVDSIDKQVKEYENGQKKEKYEKIKKAYSENIGDLESTVPFDMLFDNRYLNKTYSLKKATEDITQKIESVKADLDTLRRMKLNHRTEAVSMYCRTMSLQQALKEEERLNEFEAKVRERELQREEARKNAAQAQNEAVQPSVEPPKPASAEPERKPAEQRPEAPQEPKCRVKFSAVGTREQIKQLVEFMRANGIEYGKVQ